MSGDSGERPDPYQYVGNTHSMAAKKHIPVSKRRALRPGLIRKSEREKRGGK